MRILRAKWSVVGWEDGARIIDKDHHLIYEATIGQRDGQVWLTSLTIRTTETGQRIDNQVLHRIPARALAEQVALQLAADAANPDALMNYVTHPRRGAHDAPDLQQVARDVEAGATRRAIADKYHVSLSLVDKWKSAARREGLIKPAKTGRPPRERKNQ